MRKREKPILYSLAHSLNGFNDQGWARLEPGARNSTWVAHMSGRGFPGGICRKLDEKQSTKDSNQCFKMGCQHFWWWLCPQYPMLIQLIHPFVLSLFTLHYLHSAYSSTTTHFCLCRKPQLVLEHGNLTFL